MLVCWKRSPSPIHNHADSDCLMTIVQGIKYFLPSNGYHMNKLRIKETMELHLIRNKIHLHKIETLDENIAAVTLHCYIPSYSLYIRYMT
ncbi:hypothetical protein I4U23_020385 [Adineta vaga]|nr:hypothetical protein I4U23_020385 [Adineta vaga]